MLLAVIFVTWIGTAMVMYQMLFGNWVPTSVGEFAHEIFSTPAGRTLIVVGCAAGFLFAVVAFSISVVSIPLMLDRDVGFSVAVQTSIRVVLEIPLTMAVWALIIACALVIGSLPFFFGLAIVLPVLGHSTWHLYRRVVAD